MNLKKIFKRNFSLCQAVRYSFYFKKLGSVGQQKEIARGK